VSGSVLSVNVSRARTVDYHGETIRTGIFKTPVTGRVSMRGVNLDGDEQADRLAHGGPFRALYAYAVEDYKWWEQKLGRDLQPGEFGENLMTRGLDVTSALVGERWRVGTALLQVTVPRMPCYKLAMKMNDPLFVRRFALAMRPGAYLSIVEEGDVAAGDAIEIVSRPSHDVTIAKVAHIFFFKRSRLSELLVPELPSMWRDWILEQAG
jgi:MOSC domain-containing protein YiiM